MVQIKADREMAPGVEVANLIQKISRLVDSGEYNGSPYDFIEARRLLNNVLPQAVEVYVAAERKEAFLQAVRALEGDSQAEAVVRSLQANESPPSTKGGA